MISTSVEQSKRLVELGLDVGTADMVWWKSDLDRLSAQQAQEFMKGLKEREMNYVPAWSLEALLKLMPKSIDEGGATIYHLSIYPTWNKTWVAIYETADHYVDEEKEANTPTDAVFEMCCWLLENKKI